MCSISDQGNNNSKKDDTLVLRRMSRESVVMIDLKGKTLDEAENRAEKTGLKCDGSQEPRVSDTYEKGRDH
ncbi:MAG: PASTA domain-containing protein [Eubacterium ramulus]